MKILGSLAAEVGNALFLIRYKTVNKVVVGYAAMSIVARADNYMALTLQDLSIGSEMAASPIYYERHSNIADDMELIQGWKARKDMDIIKMTKMLFFLFLFRLMRMLYIVGYYYFLPFFVVVMVHIGTASFKLD